MCSGIAVARYDIPDDLIAQYHLTPIRRGWKSTSGDSSQDGPEEIRFMFNRAKPLLPVILGSELSIHLWGNRDNAKSRLYRTGWCRLESLEAGKWQWLNPEPVVIPATLGYEKGIWFQAHEGIRGVVVRDEEDVPHVYMLTRPASHYYETMTKHDREPVFV